VNILYVEDNRKDADKLKRRFLRMAPHISVDYAKSYQEAITKLKTQTPNEPAYDAVLTGMHVADDRGIALITFLRTNNMLIPVVVITDMGSEETVVSVLKAGASDYVVKHEDYIDRLPIILETASRRYHSEVARRVRPLSILYGEHTEADIDITRRRLALSAPHIILDIARTADQVLDKLFPAKSEDKAHGRYDILLVDYHLPGMNGVDLMKELHEVRRLDLPVVIITGHGNEEIVLQAMRLGAADYVVKNSAYLSQLPWVLENAFNRAEAGRERDALSASEAYFRSLIENSSDLIMVFGARGGIRYVSPSYERVLGYVPEEVIGLTDHILVHSDDRSRVADAIKQAMDNPGRAGRTVEVRMRHKDGSWRFIESVGMGMTDLSGEPVLVVNSRDITGRKQIEEALKASEEQYRTFINSTSDMVFLKDDEFRHVLANKQLAAFFGKGLEEIIGKTDFELMPGEGARNCRETDVRALTSYSTVVTEETVGTSVYETTKFPVGLQGNKTGVGGFIRDVSERKAIEKSVAESRQALHAILSASPIGIGRIRNRVIDWVNESLCRISGYSAEELSGKSTRIFYEDDKEYERVGKIMYQQGKIETKFVKRTGGITHSLVQVSPIDDDSYIFTATDITQQKQAEEALRKSEVLFRTLIERSSEILILATVDGKRTYVSPNISKILGYTVEEFLAGDRTSFVHPDSLPVVAATTEWVRQHPGEYMSFITRNRHKDGSWRWFEVTASNLLDEPYVNAVAINLRDITKRKQAEEALQESEAAYRTVVDNSLVGVYILQDNLIRFVNQRWCEIHGYAYEEVIDKMDPLQIVHPDDKARVIENLRKRFDGEATVIEQEFRSVRKDGKIIMVKVIGGVAPYKGKPAIVGTMIDVTRENVLESQLRQAQKMEAIGTLAGGVAHDFNNILTVLTGYGTLLQMKMDEDNPLWAYVDQIMTTSHKAAELTRSLLTFSRQQPLTLMPIDINKVVKATETLLKRLLVEDINLKTVLAPYAITIMADATQIDQILFNLASNARDAMSAGGTLTIETKAIHLDSETAELHGVDSAGPYALLSVSDTGVGMNATVREHIFDPFFTTKEVGKGTDLGLSTV